MAVDGNTANKLGGLGIVLGLILHLRILSHDQLNSARQVGIVKIWFLAGYSY